MPIGAAIGGAIAIAWDILKMGCAPIKRGFGYVMCSKRYANNLRQEVLNLDHEDQRVRSDVQAARNNLHNIHAWVPEFLASAEKALKEAKDLLGEFDAASKTCCRGTIPDPNWRYQFSRKAKSKTDYIQKLISGNANKEVYFHRPARGNVAVQSTTATASASSASTSIKPSEGGLFESRALMIQKVMDALANTSNSVVGIYGMGGVGKSTLLVDIEKRIRKENSFDWIAKADVSENPDIKRIQGEIADALGLTEIKKKETINGRAELLRERLEMEEREKKKVLIILDNLWERLDLKTVGIPCGPDNKVMGCKLLLTSRNRDVLRREMRFESDSAFLLGVLDEEEAKRLFEKMVGGKVPVELEPLVEEALRICAGLPFLIIAIAKHFIHTTYSDCKYALQNMWSGETGKVIINTLQLSYGRISDEAKSLLRLCVAYGVSKPSLEYLARYSFSLGIFRGVGSMEEVRVRLGSLINTLRASSLLLDGEDAHGFKIHYLVREFVASFASIDCPLLILKDKDKSVTELSEDKLKSCQAICFPFVDLEELPKELVCPELRIFLLFENNTSLEVSDSYFNSMKKLMALHLTGIRLSRSPSPFQILKKLHSLSLDSCSLEDVAILGELKGLQILSFAKSKIHRLPKEIRQLAELRLLDLNHCSQLQIIEPGVLESLIKLEELYMENSFDQWNVVEHSPPINASLIELNNMKNLRTLYACIPDPTMLPEDLNVKKLTRYGIRIGGRWQSSRKGLRTLELENSPSARYVFQQVVFPNLETLNIIGMCNIEMIWDNQVHYQHLTTLDVSHCHQLTNIFTPTIAGNLVELTKLRISNCKMLTEVIRDERGKEGHVVTFNQLKSMELDGLTRLRCFSSGGYTLMFPLLEDVDVTRCPNMKFFSGGPIDAPKLGRVQVSGETSFWKGNLNVTIQNMYEEMATLAGVKSKRLSEFPELIEKWHIKLPMEPFSELEVLVVDKCPSLTNAIPSTSMLALHNMISLEVRDCKSLEEIFDFEGLKAVESTQVLPQLWHLGLVDLPKLRRLWDKNLQGRLCFNFLSRLNLYRCSNLRHPFTSSMVQCLAAVEDLEIKECGEMTGVIAEEEELGKITFPNLWRMKLECLPHLTSILSGKNCTLEFPHLKRLTVIRCPNMDSFSDEYWLRNHGSPLTPELVLNFHHLNISPKEISQVAFPSLETLHITGMDKIKMIGEILVNEDTFHGLKSFLVRECNTLEGIWHEKLHHQIKFQCLRSVSVSVCKSLTSLFPTSVAMDLIQLEELEIEECGIEELIEGHELVPRFVFPKLTSLRLKHLPNLSRIHTEIHFFQHLKTLDVSHCDRLPYMLTPTTTENLVGLAELKISHCQILTEVISDEGVKEGSVGASDQLKNMDLDWLATLRRCAPEEGQGSAVETIRFPNLLRVELESLPNLTNFLAGNNRKLECPKLEELTIANCPKMTRIWTLLPRPPSFIPCICAEKQNI